MNKKQRNRKLVAQNKRNRMINRHYISTSKSLLKFLLAKIKFYKTVTDNIQKETVKTEIKKLINHSFSILDKAVKKNVIHQNKAARKKSTISKITKIF